MLGTIFVPTHERKLSKQGILLIRENKDYARGVELYKQLFKILAGWLAALWPASIFSYHKPATLLAVVWSNYPVQPLRSGALNLSQLFHPLSTGRN